MARTVADIQTDLDEAITARRVAMGAQSYSLDTGQGKQAVTRASLSDLNKTIRELQGELEQAEAEAIGSGTVTSGRFDRYQE